MIEKMVERKVSRLIHMMKFLVHNFFLLEMINVELRIIIGILKYQVRNRSYYIVLYAIFPFGWPLLLLLLYGFFELCSFLCSRRFVFYIYLIEKKRE